MKFESVDQWGVQRRSWCTSNIRSWPECYRRSQYTLPSSWWQRTHSSWYMQTTRRRMRLKDLKMVTTTVMTTLEATFWPTMVSIHEHAMQLQASQPVPPPAIPPPPCRAERNLYKMSLPHLTYRWLLYAWQRSWAYCLVGVDAVSEYFLFVCDVWLLSTLKHDVSDSQQCNFTHIDLLSNTLKKFCERHRCMSSKLKNLAKRTK